MADLFLLSLFAGLYSVPMYALIQMRSQPSHRARIIAANNILNALFMIASSVIVGALLKRRRSTMPQVFLVIGLLNAVVAFYIFMLVPEYLLRFVAFVMARLVYRFRVQGDENIPTEGAAILVCNHVSFVDPVLLMAASPRPIRFIMDHEIFKLPVLGCVLPLAKAIPIAPQKVDPRDLRAGLRARPRGARRRRPALHLPRRRASRSDGELGEFKGGVMKLLESNPVPVVPLALQNLWGSFFSRAGGKAMSRPFRRGLFSRVGLVAGDRRSRPAVTPGGAARARRRAARVPR